MSAYKDIVIFLGPPGSGKGTLSQLCVKQLGWTQLSTGNLCRQHITENTEIGQKIDFAIKSGKLITDGLIIQMVDEWLSVQLMNLKAVILDGFPRTKVQAEALQSLLQLPRLAVGRLHVIRMIIPDEGIIARLSGRSICQNNKCQAVYSDKESSLRPKQEMVCDECSSPLVRRSDDEESAIRERLLIYHKHEQEVLDFYTSVKQPVYNLYVERPIESIYHDFLSYIGIEK